MGDGAVASTSKGAKSCVRQTKTVLASIITTKRIKAVQRTGVSFATTMAQDLKALQTTISDTTLTNIQDEDQRNVSNVTSTRESVMQRGRRSQETLVANYESF